MTNNLNNIDFSKGKELVKDLCPDCATKINAALNSSAYIDDCDVLQRYANKEKVYMREKLRLPRIINRITNLTYNSACDTCKGKLWARGVGAR